MPNFTRHLTGYEAVSQVMKGFGLTAPAGVASSTDRTVQQFWELLSQEGQALLSASDWQFLEKEHSIATTGASSYAVPEDWGGYIHDSQWNRTTQMPVLGDLSEPEWQMLKARNLAGTTFTTLFRVENDTIVFYEAPASGQTIIFPYRSRGWCSAAGGGSRKDTLTADDDVIWYDPSLIRAALRLRWLIEKGFDTTKAERTFKQAKEAAISADKPRRTVSLVQGGGFPLLGQLNVPDTRYGS